MGFHASMKHVNINNARAQIFWGEIAAGDHMLQLYEDDAVFLDALEGFVRGGLKAGEGIIIIATLAHRQALEARLEASGFDLRSARAKDQYIDLDAIDTLAYFMVDGWPDDERFKLTVTQLLGRAERGHRRIRAFGEMVAVLWEQGHCGATVRLEHLWHRFCEQERFSLMCAYPMTGFTTDKAASLREICDAHTHLVAM
jgi:hypothetical protein